MTEKFLGMKKTRKEASESTNVEDEWSPHTKERKRKRERKREKDKEREKKKRERHTEKNWEEWGEALYPKLKTLNARKVKLRNYEIEFTRNNEHMKP